MKSTARVSLGIQYITEFTLGTKKGAFHYKSMLFVTVVPGQRDTAQVCCLQPVLTRKTEGANMIYLGLGVPPAEHGTGGGFHCLSVTKDVATLTILSQSSWMSRTMFNG